jgi:hypothetical protein
VTTVEGCFQAGPARPADNLGYYCRLCAIWSCSALGLSGAVCLSEPFFEVPPVLQPPPSPWPQFITHESEHEPGPNHEMSRRTPICIKTLCARLRWFVSYRHRASNTRIRTASVLLLCFLRDKTFWELINYFLWERELESIVEEQVEVHFLLLPFHYILSIGYDTDRIENTTSNNSSIFESRFVAAERFYPAVT